MSKSELRRMEIVAPEAIKELREQIAREIEELPEYTETEAHKRAGFYLDRDDVMNAIARGEK